MWVKAGVSALDSGGECEDYTSVVVVKGSEEMNLLLVFG